MSPLRVAFAGCHEISWYCLRTVADLVASHGDTLAGVFNLPPEVGARHSAFVEFDGLQSEYGFPYHKVTSLSSPETLGMLAEMRPDVLFIIGWHRIVPQSVIDSARYTVGVHASLLPRNRGSSPINWSILNGDSEGGLTLFHLTEGVDAGDIVDQRA